MPMPEELAAFDIESTGADPEQDRVVTAFAGVWNAKADAWVEEHYWLLDPGVPIAPGATAVHGYSDEDVQQAGSDAARGIFDISQRLDIFQRKGLAISGFNLRFDFTMLDREYRRHFPGGRPFEPSLVLDGSVLDKAADTYRKGKRKLVDVAGVYGVPVEENAHDAAADCLMAARLAFRLLQHRQFYSRTLQQIHDFQVTAAATQAKGLAAHFRKTGRADQAKTVQTAWPLVPAPEGTPA